MGGSDSRANRKAFIEAESQRIKSCLHITESLKENIYEGFDPLLVSHEIVDTHFTKLIRTLLDFEAETSNA